MHNPFTSTRSTFSILALLALGTAASCSDDSEPGSGSGTGGTSGATGKGGNAGSAGNSAGTAGSNATGGKGGTAGATASGGTGATAGSTSEAGGGGVPGGGGAPGETCELPFPVEAGGAGGQGGESGGGGAGGGSGGEGVEALEPTVLNTYTFDAPGSISGWGISLSQDAVGGVGDSFVSRSVEEGDACAGALRFTVPFTVYDLNSKASAQANLNGADWTGRTKLHISVKIEDNGDLNHLNGAQLFVQSNNWSVYTSQWIPGTTLADFGWHQLELDLVGSSPAVVLGDVQAVGVELLAKSTAPDGGPAAPVTTVLYIDDVWLE